MGKKSTEAKSKIDIFGTLSKIDNSVEILSKSTFSKIDEWIPTGNYILNATLSGDIFKGIPSGRVTTLAGPSGTGKSYLACSICREAQKMGYTPVYLDSEGAIDRDFVARLGCDPDNFIIRQVNTISETAGFIANMCDEFQKKVDAGGERPKIILVIDSIGNLTSDKEKADIMTGNQKADFTKAKEVKALFRVNAVPLSKLQIPTIAVSHTYADIGAYVPGQKLASGSGLQYAGSITVMLSTSKLVDKENDKEAEKHANVKKAGVLVKATIDKSRFCIKKVSTFAIPYFKAPNPYTGLQEYMNWENAGVMQGKCLTEAEFMKLKPDEQLECQPYRFEHPENGVLYAWPKKTLVKGVGIVVRHLGCQVSPDQFFSPRVFTDEYLHYINDNIIKPEFELPDQSSFDDLSELGDELIDEPETETGE